MEFEKLYMFNPFTIQNADSKEIADTYNKLQNELIDNSDTGFEIGIIVSNISPPEYPEELTIHKDEIHSRISQIYERNNIYTADDTPKAYGNLYNI